MTIRSADVVRWKEDGPAHCSPWILSNQVTISKKNIAFQILLEGRHHSRKLSSLFYTNLLCQLIDSVYVRILADIPISASNIEYWSGSQTDTHI